MKGINPFLWFDDQAKEAVSFYTSVFKRSRVGSVTRFGSIRRVGPAASEGRVPGPENPGRRGVAG
jgi:predicted 3-demethylubiquinone-9 3-methyltransferase (glyoxalase superfamily)